jgi:hypothetical protein
MNKLKFEITWEDVQGIAQRRGYYLNKNMACDLLAEIEIGLRYWFDNTKVDSISDSLGVNWWR